MTIDQVNITSLNTLLADLNKVYDVSYIGASQDNLLHDLLKKLPAQTAKQAHSNAIYWFYCIASITENLANKITEATKKTKYFNGLKVVVARPTFFYHNGNITFRFSLDGIWAPARTNFECELVFELKLQDAILKYSNIEDIINYLFNSNNYFLLLTAYIDSPAEKILGSSWHEHTIKAIYDRIYTYINVQ